MCSAVQTMTGSRNVTVTVTGYSVPVTRDGLQSSIFSVPVPVASAGFRAGQVMFHSEVVPSPDSGHPDRPPSADA